MKRFRFKLEKALELRSRREEETKVELGKAIGALSLLERRIEAVAEDRFQAASERFAPENGINGIRTYDAYILRLDATRDKLLEAAATAELQVEEAREVYIEASRERKVLDKVKERRAEEYRKLRILEEAKTLDDISNGQESRKALSD